MKNDKKIECRRCGRCCLANFTAYVTAEDTARWNAEHRKDILNILQREHGIWSGDHLVSSESGQPLQSCPFYAFDGINFGCAIYETRPATCRRYEPGSSGICPQCKKNIVKGG